MMGELAEKITTEADITDVDRAIRDAGGNPREAIRLLQVEITYLYRALAWAEKGASSGYRRARQPERGPS